MADETKRVDVIMGPYRGNLLDMPTADADAAISAHWARDPFSGEPYGTAHDPLTEEERATALEAATTWAKAQWDAVQGIGTPKSDEEGTTPASLERDLKPDEQPGGYTTRHATPAPQPTTPTSSSPRRNR